MLPKILLTGLLAALAAAAPSPETRPDDNVDGEMQLFKRDNVLSPRDLELAEAHFVNLTQMHKHSVIKRDDGDHITIWVDNGFASAEGPPEAPGQHAKRQSARLDREAHYTNYARARDRCFSHDRRDWTSAQSPYTGGVSAIHRWARDRAGYFIFGFENQGLPGYDWRDLVIAGTNSGRNARYRMRFNENPTYYRNAVGTDDVRDDARWTLDRGRNFGGRWRAASFGWETCDLDRWGWPWNTRARANYEILSTTKQV